MRDRLSSSLNLKCPLNLLVSQKLTLTSLVYLLLLVLHPFLVASAGGYGFVNVGIDAQKRHFMTRRFYDSVPEGVPEHRLFSPA